MKITLEIDTADLEWEDNACLSVTQPSKNLVEIVGNQPGLITLARHILSCAYDNDNNFPYIHYEPEFTTDNGYWYGDLEKGSLELFIAKIDKDGRKLKN